MNADEMKFLENMTLRFAGLQFLVSTLYYDLFSKYPNPAEAAQAYGEDTRIRAEKAAPAIHDEAQAIFFQEYLGQFFDDLVREFRKET